MAKTKSTRTAIEEAVTPIKNVEVPEEAVPVETAKAKPIANPKKYIISNNETDWVGDNVIDGLYPTSVLTCEDDWNSFYHTPDFDIIRNGHFFRVWYYGGKGRKRVMVEDVDLAVAFPNIK